MANRLTSRSSTFIRLTGFIFLLFYVCGLLFPDYWWSTHFLYFLPSTFKYSLIILVLLFFIAGLKPSAFLSLSNKFSFSQPIRPVISIVFLGGIMAFLFIQFPMVEDFYGEAYLLNKYLMDIPKAIPEGTNEAFFSYGMAPWDGQRTIFAMITYVSYFAGITYRDAFIYFDAFWGFLFVISWLFFLQTTLQRKIWKFIMMLAGLTAPFMLNFFGHIEINAPVLTVNFLWIVTALYYLKNRKGSILAGLFVFLLVCIKFHALALLYLPTFLLMLVNHLRKREQSEFFSWKQVSLWVLLPIFLVGVVCYFFVFEDYKDPRSLTHKVTEYERLFLPLISPEAPLDKYNMLSFNHIFDYFSEILLWSPVAFFLLTVILLFYRDRINFQTPEVMVSGIALLLFGSLFFVVNPLLSMQMDWDLFSLPVPLFLVFTVVLVAQLETTNLSIKVFAFCIALSLLSLPAFLVHQSRETLSYRLESVGKRIFKTYYEWSTLAIHNGLGLLWKDRALQLQRKENILVELHPYAIEGNDRMYAGLWIWEAKHFLRVEKNFVKALQYLENAEKYDPNDRNLILYFMETHFVMGNPDLAYPYSKRLVEISYPSKTNALMAAMQCSLEAGFYEEASQHASEYLQTNKNDSMVQEIYTRLTRGERVEELKFLFQKLN